MPKVALSSRKDGKTSLTLGEHGGHRIHVVSPYAEPYDPISHKARAWHVVSLMNGLTVAQAHDILKLLEPNIQGKVGRPLGWVVDAIDRGHVEIHDGK